MKEKLLWELEQVNLRLKSAKARVTIRESNGCLQLRATLPIKPGDEDKTGKGKKQYNLSLNIPANLPYTKADDLAIGEVLINAIDQIDKEWAKYNAVRAISVFCQLFKVEINLTNYSKVPESNSRNVPTDKDVVTGFYKFDKYLNNRGKQVNQDVKDSWQLWRWTYGMLAVFGLRPRELFVNPHIDWWLSDENIDLTWKVDKDCKTGEREALPLYKEWIDEFDLRNPKYLEMLALAISKKDQNNHAEITALIQRVSWWFRKIGLDFKPYDLRHGWAIRAHILGIPIKAAADNLGHSVQIHTKTYQRWFSLDMRKLAINQALSKRNEVELIKDENTGLKMENERLKIEVEKLRMEMVYKRS